MVAAGPHILGQAWLSLVPAAPSTPPGLLIKAGLLLVQALPVLIDCLHPWGLKFLEVGSRARARPRQVGRSPAPGWETGPEGWPLTSLGGDLLPPCPSPLWPPTLWHPLSSGSGALPACVQALGKFDLQILGNTENTPRCTETLINTQTHNLQIQTERRCNMVVRHVNITCL